MDKTLFEAAAVEHEFQASTDSASFQLAELQLAVHCGGAGEVIFG